MLWTIALILIVLWLLGFSFHIGGDAGPDYVIQASTNLAMWSTVAILSSPPAPFRWDDTNSIATPARFYRVQLAP